MNAYLRGRTSLKDDIDDILSRLTLEGSPVADSLSLYFVGTEESVYRGTMLDFSQTMELGKMPKVGTTSSDIAHLVERAFAKTSSTGVAVLVSDMVFSPGKTTPAPTYLKRQRVRIREIADSIAGSRTDFAVALIGAEADFDGVYYDYLNAQTAHRGRRPYYYLVAGPRSGVTAVAQTIVRATDGELAAYAGTSLELPYEVVQAGASNKQGSYTLNRDEISGRAKLSDGRVAPTGDYQDQIAVPVYVNLSSVATGNITAASFSVAEPSTLTIAEVTSDRTRAGYTHRLLLVNEGKAYPGSWTVTLPRANGSSMSARYLDDDRGDPSAFEGRTFGLQSIVQGLEDAFAGYDGTPLARFTIDVE